MRAASTGYLSFWLLVEFHQWEVLVGDLSVGGE